MKALIYSAYYEPEIAASLYLSTNLYEDIAKSGTIVSLYVPTPTRGVSDVDRKLYSTEKKIEYKYDDRLIIKRVSIPREGKHAIKRALRYMVLNLVFIIKSFSEKPDYIFVQSTPPTQGAMAAIIKRIKKVPLVYNLQDIFPDSLVGAGMTQKGSLIYKVGRLIENFTYKNCDRIIVISEDMKANIVSKGVPESKIDVVRNWVDVEKVHPIKKEDNYLFNKFQIKKNNFNVVYAGNLGYAQNIEVILRAAQILQKFSSIQFIIFGKGNQEDEYKRIAKKLALSNVKFFPIQPYSEVSYVYSLADVSIVPCKRGFGGSAMPSKIWSILATGTPIIASFDAGTELEKFVKNYELGEFVEADNSEELASAILKMYRAPDKLRVFSKNAVSYVEKNASRENATKSYMDIISDVVKKGKNDEDITN